MLNPEFHSPEEAKSDKFQYVENIIGHLPFFLIVHATWCPHCTTLFEKKGKTKYSIYKKLQKKHDDVLMVAVEHSVYQKILEIKPDSKFASVLRQSVQSFPTIAAVDSFKKGKVLNIQMFPEQTERSFRNLSKFIQSNF